MTATEDKAIRAVVDLARDRAEIRRQTEHLERLLELLRRWKTAKREA